VIWRRLKHLASIAVSNVDKKTVSDERSVRLCNYTDVYYNERITAELPFMEATASADQIARFGLRANDVLLTKDSETPDDIAVPAYVVADLPDVVCGYHLALLRPSREVDGRYLFWALSSRSSREQFSASANGITRFGLRYDSFSEVRVPLPPIATQRAIADYLDRETARIDALIEKKQRMLTLLEEKFLEAVRNQVTGGISFDDPLDIRSKDVINLRTGWAPVKLGQDLSFGSGTTPRAGDERYYGGHIPWIVTGDLSDDLLRAVTGSVTPDALAEFSALQVHPAGALIVAMYGATVGRLAVSGFPAAVNQACCVMHSGTRLRTWFVFYYLLSHRPVLMERAVGAGQPNISQEILRSLRIPAPDLEVQDRIVAMLNDVHTRVDRLVSTIRTQIGLLREHRQALITAAVTGELEIPGVAA